MASTSSYVAAVAGPAAAADGPGTRPAAQGMGDYDQLAAVALELAQFPPPVYKSSAIPGDATEQQREALIPVLMAHINGILRARELLPSRGFLPYTVNLVPVSSGALSAPQQYVFRVSPTEVPVARVLSANLKECAFPSLDLSLSFHVDDPIPTAASYRVLVFNWPPALATGDLAVRGLREKLGWNITHIKRVHVKGHTRLPTNKVTVFVAGPPPSSWAEAPSHLQLSQFRMPLMYFGCPNLLPGTRPPASTPRAADAAAPPPEVAVPAAGAADAVSPPHEVAVSAAGAADAAAPVPEVAVPAEGTADAVSPPPEAAIASGPAVAVADPTLASGAAGLAAAVPPPSLESGAHVASPPLSPRLGASSVVRAAAVAPEVALALENPPPSPAVIAARPPSSSSRALPDDKGKRPARIASPAPSGTYSPTQRDGSPPLRPKQAAHFDEDGDSPYIPTLRRQRVNPAPSPSLFRVGPAPSPSRSSSPSGLCGGDDPVPGLAADEDDLMSQSDDEGLMSQSDDEGFSASPGSLSNTMDEDTK
jgi:hypothetical protein